MRDVCVLAALKNKFGPFAPFFGVLLWKRSADGRVEEQWLLDTERPAALLALWQAGWFSTLFFSFSKNKTLIFFNIFDNFDNLFYLTKKILLILFVFF